MGAISSELSHSQYRRALFWIMALSLGVRFVFAALIPLGIDEAYEIAVAREFSWSFFDHPPLGFWAPVVVAKLIGIENTFIFRLPSLIFGTLSMGLIAALGRELGGARAGIWAAVLYGIAPVFALAGVFALPDGPLEMGSLLAVLWLVRITRADGDVPMGHWLWAGAGLALALGSKYQAGLIPISALVFVALSPVGRRWFSSAGLYVASLIGLLGLLPVLLWNVQNGWASFVFHSGRTGDGLSLGNFAVMALGQGIYLLPPVFVLALLGLKQGLTARRPEMLLVSLIALGPIVAFNLIYLFSAHSFPHWSMPGWLFALPLAAVWLSQGIGAREGRTKRWLVGFTALFLVVLLLVLAHVRVGLLSMRVDGPVPDWDNTMESFDYSALRGELDVITDMSQVDMIATRDWIRGGVMSTALAGEYPVRILGDNKHHFAYMRGDSLGGMALLLDPQPLAAGPWAMNGLLAQAQEIDPSAKALAPVVLRRGSRPYVQVNVIKMRLPQE